MMDLEQELQRRNEALSTMDMEWARKMMPHATNDLVRETAMHKARYECTAIAAELRHASGQWLKDHGLHRIGGLPVLPAGELPN